MLLRAAIGSVALLQGAAYLHESQGSPFEIGVLGSLLLIAGTALLAGCFTPIASLVVAVVALGTALAWLRAPLYNFLDSAVTTMVIFVVAAALFLLGPGAISIDARLFGLREIAIPQTYRNPKDAD